MQTRDIGAVMLTQTRCPPITKGRLITNIYLHSSIKFPVAGLGFRELLVVRVEHRFMCPQGSSRMVNISWNRPEWEVLLQKPKGAIWAEECQKPSDFQGCMGRAKRGTERKRKILIREEVKRIKTVGFTYWISNLTVSQMRNIVPSVLLHFSKERWTEQNGNRKQQKQNTTGTEQNRTEQKQNRTKIEQNRNRTEEKRREQNRTAQNRNRTEQKQKQNGNRTETETETE
jgi:hypothetical protein